MRRKKCQAVDGFHVCSHEVLHKILTPAVMTKLTAMNILPSQQNRKNVSGNGDAGNKGETRG